MSLGKTGATAQQTYRLMTISDPNTAVGAAARLMMTYPAFALRPFGEWMQVLDGEARRGHQIFVLDETNKLVGYFGYALATEALAEAWAAGRRDPSDAECRDGDCLIFNGWISSDRRVLRFMWNAFRRLASGKKAAYYKRFYRDGTQRVVRLPINAAVPAHIERSAPLWAELASAADQLIS